MSNTHTHHHSHTHEGPHGPHCEDELRRDVEERREELGHTVEELAARADVKARARTKLRETRQQAEARRTELRDRAVQAKERVRSRSSSSDDVEAGYQPSGVTGSGMTGSGAYRADQVEESDRRKQLMAVGGAALAACAAGVLIRRSGHSPVAGHTMGGRHMGGAVGKHTMGKLPVGGRSMGRRTMGKHTMGKLPMGGHTMGGHAMKSMHSLGKGGHHGAPGGSAMRGMALKRGAAMTGGAPLLGAKVAQRGVSRSGALMRAGTDTGGGRSSATGLTHSLAHSLAPDQGLAHRLEHAMGRGHRHHGPAGLWH